MASLAEKEKKRSKESSILGVALARSLNCASGADAPRSGEAVPPPQPPPPSSSPSASPSAASDVHRKISDKYAALVLECDQKRRERLRPLSRQRHDAPIERDLASSLKSELDATLQRLGGAGAGGAGASGASDGGARGGALLTSAAAADGWDGLEKNDGFQKSMQFLLDHSRTGRFSDELGDASKFEGELMYGMRHGPGRQEFRGEVYEGEWKWDKWHGIGTLTAKDGSVTKGGFQNGKPHGHASVLDKKGKVLYEGEFKDGRRHGHGRQLFESGDVYEGGWEDGQLHGRGLYYFTNGDKMDGSWCCGKYDGPCTYHHADGSRSRHLYALDEEKRSRLVSVQECEGTSQRWAGPQLAAACGRGGDPLAAASVAAAGILASVAQ